MDSRIQSKKYLNMETQLPSYKCSSQFVDYRWRNYILNVSNEMNIRRKHIWLKFIPLIGIIFCIIDTSWDGLFWEKIYLLYHATWLAILVVNITR